MQKNLIKNKVILLTNANSIKGRSMLISIQNSNLEIERVIVINTNIKYYLKLFKFVSKRVGLIQAIIFSVLKLISDNIHELIFYNIKNLSSLIKEYRVSPIYIKGDENWENKANRAIESCDSKIVVIGQVGILGKEFNLERNDRLIINSHPGMLPKYRGLDSFKWAILKNDWDSIKSTIHIVRGKIDGGEILQINTFDWRKLNWFFIDRELLIISGNHLIKFISNLKSENIVKEIIDKSENQKKEYRLYHKMSLLNEFKSFKKYIYNKYLKK